MAGSALKRLMAEYKQLTLNPPEGIVAGPINEENFFEWEALIVGPDGTCFEGTDLKGPHTVNFNITFCSISQKPVPLEVISIVKSQSLHVRLGDFQQSVCIMSYLVYPPDGTLIQSKFLNRLYILLEDQTIPLRFLGIQDTHVFAQASFKLQGILD